MHAFDIHVTPLAVQPSGTWGSPQLSRLRGFHPGNRLEKQVVFALTSLYCAGKGRCDDSKCTSIGGDCYAPGHEAKTCAPGYHAEDSQHGRLYQRYTCCPLCPDGFHHCTSAQGGKGQEVLGLLGAFCDRDPDCYGDDGFCDGRAQTGCIAAPTGSWDGVPVYLCACLSARRKRL